MGEGTYGEVYKARTREPGARLLAIKTFKAGKAWLNPAPQQVCMPQRCTLTQV